MLRPLPLALACASLLLGLTLTRAGDDPRAALERVDRSTPLRVWPFGLMDSVRRGDGRVPMGVEVCNTGNAPLFLDAVEVLDGAERVLTTVPLHGEAIAGDGGFVEDLLLKLETISPDLSHRHTHRLFIPLQSRDELGPDAEVALLREIVDGVRVLQADGAPQLRKLRFEVDLGALFGAGAQAGDRAAVAARVRGRDAGGAAFATSLRHEIELLEPFFNPPAQRLAASGPGAWHAGDLHVHNCRDEAIGGCDSCPAETVNLTGGFTNAQLKSQFQALGFDFFSTTTHSYCINSDTEFNSVLSESQSLTDPSFVLICGTEISGREAGPQLGGDGADVLCALGFGEDVHHMGSHGITTRKPGGDDDVLDFCDRPINTQSVNYNEANAEGGFTIANHPAAAFWAYNSVAYMQGQEGGGVWGVEVWNGSESSGTFSNAYTNWWLSRLREGRLLYPYSGSDTHDAAYNFGATHTFVSGAFTSAGLIDALKGGRSYLSNGPFLEMEVRGGGQTLQMGQLMAAPGSQIPPGFQAEVEVFYNVGTSLPTTLTIYRGSLTGEVVIGQQSGLLGGGSLLVNDPVPAQSCYWRAEAVNTNFSGSALTTPIFLRIL
jgi:hypothetical protein